MDHHAFHKKRGLARELAVFCAVFLLAASSLRAQLNVYFVDVGQGDAIYIEFPNGTNALIDGGSGGEPIYKFLTKKGVTKLDRVVLTHPHSDHYRGLKKVFNFFDVKSFYDTKAENINAQGDNNLRELAAAEPGCGTYFPSSGAELKWDSKVTVKVLNSCDETVQIRDNDETNNCSLVLRLYYNGAGILLMADSEATIENTITKIFKSGLQSYALKVGHHGSRYSSTGHFLSRVQPKVAIISAGVNNVYGHPHAEAIERLRAAGAKIYYTTNGTQNLHIPAPKMGVEPVLEGPLPYDPLEAAQPPAVKELIYTPEVQAPASVNTQALDQLKQTADAQ
ncbi:MAG: hypothetical protein A2234_07285 [Elusimicrobia bacterium RIFOXYA2_FULL_58_8]|nr:MAG: hypothetical protein A2234_07285 [Elusimicrobia bacterium RIFOXYA2_FULL_58_8]OGS13313.1 MAG: hypothetical protein A2285_02030 [Elusimicrobia bacterium RIFOXYA12_FULL_57_11]